MATILEFKCGARPTVSSVLAAYGAGQSAEIVLFPGVRYERHDQGAETKPAKSRSRRDTLELES